MSKDKFEQKEISQFPKHNKDYIQKIVQLKKDMRNAGGEFFPKGTLMIISSRHKGDGTITLRPLKGGLIVSEDNCRFIGSKQDFGFNVNQ